MKLNEYDLDNEDFLAYYFNVSIIPQYICSSYK